MFHTLLHQGCGLVTFGNNDYIANMKLATHLFALLAALLLLGSCGKEGCTDPNSPNYDPEATEDDGSCVWVCGDALTYQGYDYATVLIGDQCWFAENLRSENYENGDAIPSGLSSSEWSSTSLGAVTVYGEGNIPCEDYSPDSSACNEVWSFNEYGCLYNWHVVDDARGLCPNGWHVPSDGEWTVLTDELGGESVAGGYMKTTYGWGQGGNGTNQSGFSGLPGGGRSFQPELEDFDYAGIDGFWWSSSPTAIGAWNRSLYSLFNNVLRYEFSSNSGFSVRCVRDAE